jgi:acyl-CoA-binding protein
LPQDKPDYFDAEGTVKWNAWNAIAHMAKETAAQRYIAESKRQRTPMSQR